MHPERESRLPFPVVACIAVVVCLYLFRMGFIWLSSPEWLVASTPDDAWYYVAIAQNISTGAGSSFDGLTTTNGYQPLWLLVCSTVALLVEGKSVSPESSLLLGRTLLTLQLFAGAASMIMLLIRLRRHFSRAIAWPWISAVYTIPFAVYACTDGMESGLVLLLLAVILWLADRFAIFTSGVSDKDLAFGAALSLLVLARLDLGLFIAGLLLALLFSAISWRAILTRALLWGVPVAITLGAYLFINSLHFDTLLPISGKLKLTFPSPACSSRILYGNLVFLFLGLAIIATAIVAWRDESHARSLRLFCLSAAAYVTCHLVLIFVYTDWAVHQWHFSAYWFLLAITGVCAIGRMEFTASRLYAPALALACLALAIGGQWAFFHGRTGRAFQVQSRAAALWARENLSLAALLAMTDSGVFGCFMGGRVVNLDGVVNNAAYQKALVERGAESCLADRGVRYIARHAVPLESVGQGYGEYTFTLYSHLYNQPSGTVTLRQTDEIYRGPVYDDGGGEKVFVIWRFPAPAAGRFPELTSREPDAPTTRGEDRH